MVHISVYRVIILLASHPASLAGSGASFFYTIAHKKNLKQIWNYAIGYNECLGGSWSVIYKFAIGKIDVLVVLRKIRLSLAAIDFTLITLLFLDFTGTLHRWLG